MSKDFAFYLKYRPQTLDELIGQEHVKKILSSSFQNRLSHAYLFVGPRGTGKTSTARILAKMVNCERAVGYLPLAVRSEKANSQQPTANSELPCNKCPTCLSITDGSNLDLIEIDAASNRGIDDIRSLRDKIKLAPSAARKKVYIIDEVHMLTLEAFNALLKTLEDPPKHALFILATTEGSKIPQTILSRVQRLDFKLATSEEILKALSRIVKGEKINIDDGALKILAKKSDGSFRDGVKLLDQVASLDGKITAKIIEENLKSFGFEDILDLIKSLKSQNVSLSLLSVAKQIENGVDVKEFIFSLMDVFRNLILIKNDVGEQLVKVNLTEDRYQSLVDLCQDFTISDIARDLEILQDALEKLKFTSIPSLPLELAVVEICEGNSNVKSQNSKIPVILGTNEVRTPESNSKDSGRASGKSEFPSLVPIISGSRQVGARMTQTEEGDSSDVASYSDDSDILKLKEKWTFVLETIRPYNFSLEALLRSITLTQCTEDKVFIEVPYSFHQRILEAPKNRDLLEGILSDILGRSVRISVSLGTHIARKEDIANIELAADDEIIKAAAEIFNSDTIN